MEISSLWLVKMAKIAKIAAAGDIFHVIDDDYGFGSAEDSLLSQRERLSEALE